MQSSGEREIVRREVRSGGRVWVEEGATGVGGLAGTKKAGREATVDFWVSVSCFPPFTREVRVRGGGWGGVGGSG